jgi:hypothetical protein
MFICLFYDVVSRLRTHLQNKVGYISDVHVDKGVLLFLLGTALCTGLNERYSNPITGLDRP